MPRRKQNTPQRLKLKACSQQEPNVLRIDHDISKSEGASGSGDVMKIEKTENTQSRTESAFTSQNASVSLSEEPRSKLNSMSQFTVSKTSHFSNTCSSSQRKYSSETSSKNCEIASSSEFSQNSISDDKSSLQALAAAAALRSSSPGDFPRRTVGDRQSEEEFVLPAKKMSRCSATSGQDSSPEPRNYSHKRKTSTKEPLHSLSHSADHLLAVQLAAAHGGMYLPNFPTDKIKKNDKHKSSELNLMEAMMQRERQLYEEYGGNNWLRMQRNDNNCLSKSKAERYRWCVQENGNNGNKMKTHSTRTGESLPEGSSSEVANVKKSFRSNVSMQDKLYSTVFTGASKFRCRDCGKPFNTLVDLTVHMSKTGHYRDQNIEESSSKKGGLDTNKFVKPKKRSLVEMEEKESAEKVLKCLGCGHSFDSLQDLSVHMIKTKHYEDIPSLRFYSQKNDFCSNNSQPVDDKSVNSSQKNNNNTSGLERVTESESEKTIPDSDQRIGQDYKTMNMSSYPAMLGRLPNLSSMHTLAAQSLLGFSPYALPFASALNGYVATNPAFAAAATSLLLSSPWLAQMSGFAPAGLFSPLLGHYSGFPTTVMSPISRENDTPPPIHPNSFDAKSTSMQSESGKSSRQSDDFQRTKSQVLQCTQCGDSFSSLQKLTNHMQETTHFPDGKSSSPFRSERQSPKHSPQSPVLTNQGISRFSPSVPNSSPLENLENLAKGKPMNDDGPFYSTSRSASDTERKGSPSDYVETHSVKRKKYRRTSTTESAEESKDSSTSTGFDFIKSLEHTIQNAISKVNESPFTKQRLQTSSPDNSHSPIAIKMDRSTPSTSKPFISPRTPQVERKSISPKNSPLAASTENHRRTQALEVAKAIQDSLAKSQNDSNPTPLNLTTSNGITRHKSSQICSVSEAPKAKYLKTSVEENELNGVTKNPLQCIQENIHNFFSGKSQSFDSRSLYTSKSPTKPLESVSDIQLARGTKRHADMVVREKVRKLSSSPPSKTKTRERKLSYSPTDKASTNSINPLEEMQKIVNSTALIRRPENMCKIAENKTGSKSEGSTKFSKPFSAKHYKTCSVLSDLVTHEDTEYSPVVNPLTQMENLVNLRIGENLPPNRRMPTTSTVDMGSNSLGVTKSSSTNGINGTISEKSHSFTNGTDSPSPFGYSNGKNASRISTNREQSDKYVGKNKSKLPKDKWNKVCGVHGSDKPPCNNLTSSDEAEQLREKMVNFFHSMVSESKTRQSDSATPQQDRTLPKEYEKCGNLVPHEKRNDVARAVKLEPSESPPIYSSDPTPMSLEQKIKLQIHYLSLFENEAMSERWDDVADNLGIEQDVVKRWALEVAQETSNSRKFAFNSPDGENLYQCTVYESCRRTGKRFSSKHDFMRHLCKHLEEFQPRTLCPKLELDCSRKDWKMIYKGEMRIAPFSSSSSEFSVTAHVANSTGEENSSEAKEMTPSPSSDVINTRAHCVDGIKVED